MNSSSTGVIVQTDLSDFFRQEVSEARDALGIDVTELTEFYLVNLLCDYSKPGQVPMPGEEPLAILYQRSLEASTAERIQILKNLGDVALYASGFFAEFIERSIVDLSYYISMGGNAYSSLSGIVSNQGGWGRTGRDSAFAEVYRQLAGRFEEVVAILAEVCDRSRQAAQGDAAIVQLYDRWSRTGDARVQRLLREKGLLDGDGGPETIN